jgi:capsular exopolysaccharide synthesis family protein
MAGSYVGRLSASWAEKGAGVINLSITGNNPQKEMDFMNGLIKRYQIYDLEKKNLTASRTIDFINRQLSEISDSLRHVENVLEGFKSAHPNTNLSEEASRLYEKLEAVELQKTEILIHANYNQYLIDYIKNESNLDQVILPSSVGYDDGVLADLISKMISIELEMKRIVGNGSQENPLIQQKQASLNEIKRSIVESIKNQQNTDKIKDSFIKKQIQTLERQLDTLPAAERQYISISRNYSLLENLYVFLLQKRSEAGISKASATSDVEVVNRPMAGGPIYPKPFQNYLLAVLLGIGIPFALFFLMEYLNVRIQSREDIDKLTSIPFIGGVGHKKSGSNLAVIDSPKSMIAESFRALRSNLSYFVKKEQSTVILISSSISGEGKTFVSINLATVMAFSGKKTLIVGADLRRPKIFSDFNLANDKGLSTYLAGLNSFDEVVQNTGVENLDLVSGGPMPPNPSELMLRPEMKDFFKTAKERYDFIIIDSPPLAIVSDALLLNVHADHLLFLVRQNYTQKDFLKSVNEFYNSGRLENMSIVLNDIYKSGMGYGYGSGYAYGYGYSYSYGSKKNGYGYYDEQSTPDKNLWNRWFGS